MSVAKIEIIFKKRIICDRKSYIFQVPDTKIFRFVVFGRFLFVVYAFFLAVFENLLLLALLPVGVPDIISLHSSRVRSFATFSLGIL